MELVSLFYSLFSKPNLSWMLCEEQDLRSFFRPEQRKWKECHTNSEYTADNQICKIISTNYPWLNNKNRVFFLEKIRWMKWTILCMKSEKEQEHIPSIYYFSIFITNYKGNFQWKTDLNFKKTINLGILSLQFKIDVITDETKKRGISRWSHTTMV